MKNLSNVMFITDLDGTLLPSNKKINPTDLDAIDTFRQFGGHFSVATGRSIQSAQRYFKPLKLDEPAIVCNGGGIYDCSNECFVWQEFVDGSACELVESIFENFPEIGGEISFSNEIVVPRLTIQEEYHLDISYKKTEYRIDKYENIPKDGWCKVLFAAMPDEIDRLIEYVGKNGSGKVTFVRSSKYFYEILPCGCSKGAALERLVDLYKRRGWIIAACGDFDNDLEMINFANIGIAPSNAQNCIKNAASFVTDADCESGAVADALNYVMNAV
ncbi:MAG: Cof-type HAD-IIB family hydrolase [Oscillospiraceae bacterium]|nr:Cof-type HAD-IIB family hydrolase [Oscillospiraceae bacterium]